MEYDFRRSQQYECSCANYNKRGNYGSSYKPIVYKNNLGFKGKYK